MAGQVVNCPYTASNCPLFNPVFSINSILNPYNPNASLAGPSNQSPPASFCASVHGGSPKDSPKLPAYTEPAGEQNDSCAGMPTPPLGLDAGTLSQEQLSDIEDMLGGFYGNLPQAQPQQPQQPQQQRQPSPTGEVKPMPQSASPEMSYARSHSESLPAPAAPAKQDEVVTPFISKLLHLLSHDEYADAICWSRDGRSFVFAHNHPELLQAFARLFRHANVQSFVRQLNIYGFLRLTTVDLLQVLSDVTEANSSAQSGLHKSLFHLGKATVHSNGGSASPEWDGNYQQHFSGNASDFSGFSHPLFFRAPSPGVHVDYSGVKPKTVPRKSAPRRKAPALKNSYTSSSDEEDGYSPSGSKAKRARR